MSEKYVAEYVEILDDHGERKGVCVTDTEHTVSFEVKDEIAAMELCELLNKLFGENEELGISIKLFEDDVNRLSKENEQLRMKLKGEDYIMVSEMLSNLRKTGICDGCKNKDKPVEWYLERGFSITEQICDRYEPE